MVTGRPVQGGPDGVLVIEQSIDERTGTPGSVQRRIVGVLAECRIGIDRAAARQGDALDQVDVRGRVDGLELLARRRRRLVGLVAEPARGGQRPVDRLDSGRLLRMGSDVVEQRRPVAEERGSEHR